MESVVTATGKKPEAVKPKRLGANALHAAEQLSSMGAVLNWQQASSYGALAAMANYLALDGPDVSFAAEKICKRFARPTAAALNALQRFVRYHVRQPRLVYECGFDDATKELTTFVDRWCTQVVW